jgi:hypothetical protein
MNVYIYNKHWTSLPHNKFDAYNSTNLPKRLENYDLNRVIIKQVNWGSGGGEKI